MKNHTVTNTLALAGAMIVIFAVSAAARTAFADEATTGFETSTTVDTTATAIHNAADQSLVEARQANESAVEEAAKAVAEDTESKLEFRLQDHKSTLIARGH